MTAEKQHDQDAGWPWLPGRKASPHTGHDRSRATRKCYKTQQKNMDTGAECIDCLEKKNCVIFISSSFNPVAVDFCSKFAELIWASLEILEQTGLWSVVKGRLVFLTACTSQLNPFTSHKQQKKPLPHFAFDVCRKCRSQIISVKEIPHIANRTFQYISINKTRAHLIFSSVYWPVGARG